MKQEFANRHATWAKPDATYLYFDSGTPDPAARLAISLSLDRKALAEGLMDNQAEPATRLYPPAIAPGGPSGICRPCDHDTAEAKKLRDQAGLKTLTIDGDKRGTRAVADQIRAALDVTAEGGPGPGPALSTSPSNIDSPHYLFTFVDIPSIKPFLDAAAASGDPAIQAENYRLAENEVLRDLSFVPLWSPHGHAVWGERVHDVTANAAHDIDLTAITL